MSRRTPLSSFHTRLLLGVHSGEAHGTAEQKWAERHPPGWRSSSAWEDRPESQEETRTDALGLTTCFFHGRWLVCAALGKQNSRMGHQGAPLPPTEVRLQPGDQITGILQVLERMFSTLGVKVQVDSPPPSVGGTAVGGGERKCY